MPNNKSKAKSGQTKKSRKSIRTPSNERPEERGDADESADETAPSKTLSNLSIDELRKESIKLGIFAAGEKPKKELCILKLSVFLFRHNFEPETFKFAAKGLKKIPQVLLNSQTPFNSDKDSDKKNDSDSSSSDSDSENQRRKKKEKRKKDKSKKKSKTLSAAEPTATHVILPAEWHMVTHPVTGNPIGMLDPSETFRSLENPASPPASRAPTIDLTTATSPRRLVRFSDAAEALLGGGSTPTAYTATTSTPRTPSGINSELVDFRN